MNACTNSPKIVPIRNSSIILVLLYYQIKKSKKVMTFFADKNNKFETLMRSFYVFVQQT